MDSKKLLIPDQATVIKPFKERKFREVTEPELHEFVASYPRPLESDVTHICDPPLQTYNDWTLGDWGESIVARVVLDDPPRGKGRTYEILDIEYEHEQEGSGI